ncbi:hypothetical protein [Laceyella putida]|uniref:DUF3137 domain-containing protein n=1 Tax=Laceyella putida TaxID=110101 RepID=A0ABW2RPW6_9BACL
MSLLHVRYKQLSEKYHELDPAKQQRIKAKLVKQLKRRKRMGGIWNQMMLRIQREGWKWAIVLLGIAGLVWLAYVGVKFWAGMPGLQAEENAAIITGIVAFITLGITVYSNRRSQMLGQRSFAHSRIYDQKMEAYTQIAQILHNLNMAYFAYDFSGDAKYADRVRTLFAQVIGEIVPKYLLFISNDVLDYINDMAHTMPGHDQETETEIDEKYEQFLFYYYEPIMDEFRKELGTESITKELREMVEFQSSEQFRLF